MSKKQPHEFFRIDFDIILKEAERQENMDPNNKGELSIAKNMHAYFDKIILPLIISNDWVFESALRFATEFTTDCFHYLLLGGNEVYKIQNNLLEIKKEVIDLINEAKEQNVLKVNNKIQLTKASDFYNILDQSKLFEPLKQNAIKLYEKSLEEELLLLKVTLRAHRDIYESVLPRIMYVIRRAIKEDLGLPHRRSDDELLGISESIDFYKNNINNSHPFYQILGNLYKYYRVARNVGNHFQGLKWDSENNLVILEDQSGTPLTISLHEFQKRYRYFIYFNEFGLRGILSSFSEREKGEISNDLVLKYIESFGQDFPSDDPKGEVAFYL